MTVIALDLDGTLEDSRRDLIGVVQRHRRRLKLPACPDAIFRTHVIRGMDHLYDACFGEHLAGAGPRDARREALRIAFEADYAAHIIDTTRLYDGIADALPRLAAIGRLAVVTNKPEALSHQLLTALGVRHHFAAVIGGDSVAHEKPDPLPLAEAVKRCGGGPAIMIGDSPGDMLCGRAYGAPTVWCAWGYYPEPPGHADRIAGHPIELAPAVLALQRLVD